nr:hypothetical protein CPGR_00079 [Mycolicibacterium fortuitum subsp. fortuitum DSM 46621 = ATCC 6841 = JCM 6387]
MPTGGLLTTGLRDDVSLPAHDEVNTGGSDGAGCRGFDGDSGVGGGFTGFGMISGVVGGAGSWTGFGVRTSGVVPTAASASATAKS